MRLFVSVVGWLWACVCVGRLPGLLSIGSCAQAPLRAELVCEVCMWVCGFVGPLERLYQLPLLNSLFQVDPFTWFSVSVFNMISI